MAVTKLDEEAILKRLGDLDGWTLEGRDHALEKDWRFTDFAHAMLFANAVAHIAEQQDHHPDMSVGYGYVRIVLSTLSAGGITERDFTFARELDRTPLKRYLKDT